MLLGADKIVSSAAASLPGVRQDVFMIGRGHPSPLTEPPAVAYLST